MVYLIDYECIVKNWEAFFVYVVLVLGCEEKLSKYCKKIDLKFSKIHRKLGKFLFNFEDF